MKWRSLRPWEKWALFAVLTGAAVMSMGSDDQQRPARTGRAENQVAAASPRQAEATKQMPPDARVQLERAPAQRQQPEGGKIGNAFKASSWYVPPPPLPLPPPPKPVAPPLPFTYLGQYMNPDSSIRIVILARADRVYTVSEGDVIDGTYRIGPVVAGMLEIIYLPLNTTQSLNMGGIS